MKLGDFKLRDDEENYIKTWLSSWFASGCYNLRTQINKAISEDVFIAFIAEEARKRSPKEKERRKADPKVKDSSIPKQKDSNKEKN